MHLLLIDTTTDICSVALSKDSKIIAEQQANTSNAHAAALTLLIENLLSDANLTIKDLSAIAISSGPGSYTGLRIGTATAKGLCFAADIPLLSISTLQALADTAMHQMPDALHIPMLDARRMEVYTAIYDKNAQPLCEIEPLIIYDETFLTRLLEKNHLDASHKIAICGNGAEKCKDLLHAENVYYLPITCHASNLLNIAQQKIAQKAFENLAYFEPFYLKGANITLPKTTLS